MFGLNTYNHSSVTALASTLPNAANQGWGGSNGTGGTANFTSFGSDDYSPKSETYFVKVPHTAGPSKHSNKVRIEDNTLRNNQLARDKSYEISSFDSNPLDSEDVSVVLSPADQIDTDISMQFGGFNLDDYIGDPRDTYKTEYTSLRDTNNLYFKKYDDQLDRFMLNKCVGDTMNRVIMDKLKPLVEAVNNEQVRLKSENPEEESSLQAFINVAEKNPNKVTSL